MAKRLDKKLMKDNMVQSIVISKISEEEVVVEIKYADSTVSKRNINIPEYIDLDICGKECASGIIMRERMKSFQRNRAVDSFNKAVLISSEKLNVMHGIDLEVKKIMVKESNIIAHITASKDGEEFMSSAVSANFDEVDGVDFVCNGIFNEVKKALSRMMSRKMLKYLSGES